MFKFVDKPSDNKTNTHHSAPGQIRFDDRGNAIYEWRDARLELDGKQGEKLRERALLNTNLSLVDEGPTADSTAIRNDKGLYTGYNPYNSGQLAGKAPARKRDMRELSKWIEMKRRLDAQDKGTPLKK